MRSIMHFCLNSFCAAIEQIRRPELAGKPVVVVFSSGREDLVASASPEATAQGVRESMTARHAGRYCPNAVFIPVDWGVYRAASDSVTDILSEYSPLLEPCALDKAYMDVTGCRTLFGPPKSIASEVRRRIREKVGVPVSIGVGQSKLLALAASMSCEPGGYLEIEPGKEREFLALLPVGFLPGVGEKIEKRLTNLGVRTVGGLAAIPQRMLLRQFGALGDRLYKQSHGIDHTRVMALYPPPVISTEHTFPEDVCEPELVEAHLLRMCDHLAMELRKRDEQASMVTLRLEFERFPVTRSYTFKSPVSSVHGIYTGARRILHLEMRRYPPTPEAGGKGEGDTHAYADPPTLTLPLQGGGEITSMKLMLGGLRSGGGIQLSFIGDAERRRKLAAVLETIRSRFGERAIACGMV